MRIIFFFNDTATTEIYTLSLHDALPICPGCARIGGRGDRRGAGLPPAGPRAAARPRQPRAGGGSGARARRVAGRLRSEEHTSELQSRQYLVCRLLLEKKKNNTIESTPIT